MKQRHHLEAISLDFAPTIVQAQHRLPAPLPQLVLYSLLALVGVMLVWSIVSRLDIVAVAQGKLVPEGFVKIVQPMESGIVKEILVKEGDPVVSGQVLMRMDARISEADSKIVENELTLRGLQLRRIDSELSGNALERKGGDPSAVFGQVEAQYRARRQTYLDTLDGELTVLAKAKADLRAATEVELKLKRVAPIYRDQSESWDKLAKEGFAGRLMALDRQRSYIEADQDLRAQAHTIDSLKALISKSEKRIAQIKSNYRQQLQDERMEVSGQYLKLQQEWEKQQHRQALLELKAPQDGIVKDLATHTVGTVVAPGTVLLTLVPRQDPLQAEIWVSNLDAGFVQHDQPVKLKLMAFPFQQYGMLDGVVRQVSADATDNRDINGGKSNVPGDPLQYRALVALKTSQLEHDGRKLKLAPGMQVTAEIILGSRTVMEYLLSPLQKIAHEAGRER